MEWESNAAFMQAMVDELREQNPNVAPEILRKTVYHIANIGPEMALETVAETTGTPLLYAECQAYMDGFAAAVDGDYDTDDVELDPVVEQLEETSARLKDFSDVLPSYMLARASHYAADVAVSQPSDVESVFGESIAAVSACGFVNGFSAAIKEKDNGHSFRPAHPLRSRAFFAKQASAVIDENLGEGHDDLRLLTASYMEKLSSRKISTISGKSRFDASTEKECLYVYGTGFVHGVMSAVGNVQDSRPLSFEDMDFAASDAEIDSWCRMNGYSPNVPLLASEHSRALIDAIDGDEDDSGMYLLNGWGYADGYAAICGCERPIYDYDVF